MFSIGVYVTSRYKNYPEFKQYMDGAIKKFLPTGKPSALVSGDYKTNNAGNGLVARYAFENNIPFRRFATMWAKHNPNKSGKTNNAGVASNSVIIKNSNGCILFWTPTSIAKWNFMSGGCYSFKKLCDADHMSRPIIPIKVDIYKSFTDDEEHADTEELMSAPVDMGDGTQMSGIGDIDGIPDSSPMNLGGTKPSGGGASIGLSMPSGMSPQPQSAPQPTDMAIDDDSIGDIDDNATNAAGTSKSLISQMNIDTNGDGTGDTTITAIDTNNDGTADSQLVPQDTNNNGVVDNIAIKPLPNTQPPPNAQPMSQNNAAQQSVATTQSTDDEKIKTS